MPTAKKEDQLTSLERAFQPFTLWRHRPVHMHIGPPPVETAVIAVKSNLFRQWEHDDWVRGGALLTWLDSYVPTEGLRPILTAMAAFTKRLVYVGDLAPQELAMFMRVKSALPPRVRLAYAGIDDEWLAKEQASRTGVGSPYYEMDAPEARLWRTLKGAHPSVVKLIGPKATALLDRGLNLALEGACAIGWHQHTMLKLAFRRAMGRSPPRTRKRTT